MAESLNVEPINTKGWLHTVTILIVVAVSCVCVCESLKLGWDIQHERSSQFNSQGHKDKKIWAVWAHAFSPSIWESEGDRSPESTGSLVYSVCFKTIRATQRNTVTGKKKSFRYTDYILYGRCLRVRYSGTGLWSQHFRGRGRRIRSYTRSSVTTNWIWGQSGYMKPCSKKHKLK